MGWADPSPLVRVLNLVLFLPWGREEEDEKEEEEEVRLPSLAGRAAVLRTSMS